MGTATMKYFVRVSDDDLVGLGTFEDGGSTDMILTDYEGFKNGDDDIHNDILLDTEQ